MPSGLELLQQTIQTCDSVVEGVGSSDGAPEKWKPAMADIAETLKGLTASFFFKTTPSVPATRTCQRDAAALKDLLDQGDWSGFAEALDRLRKSVKGLAEKASMKGTILT